MDKVNINELGMRMKLEEEIKRFNLLQKLASKGTHKPTIDESDVNTSSRKTVGGVFVILLATFGLTRSTRKAHTSPLGRS